MSTLQIVIEIRDNICKVSHCSGFSRATELIGDMYIYRKKFIELAHMILKAEKSQDLQSTSQ